MIEIEFCSRCHQIKENNGKRRCNKCIDYDLFRRYGLKPHEKEQLIEAQKGLCYLCNENWQVVDHEHGPTGRVRALLCNICNMKLGIIEALKFKEWYVDALAFIESPPAPKILKSL